MNGTDINNENANNSTTTLEDAATSALYEQMEAYLRSTLESGVMEQMLKNN